MSDWNTLGAAWRDDDDTAARAPDLDALIAGARRGRRRQQRRFAIEVLASVVVVAFWAPQLVEGGAGVRLLGGGSIVFVAVWCAVLWHTLRGTWSSSAVTTSAFIDLERARLAAKQRWTVVVRGAVVAMGVLFAVALPLLVVDGGDLYRREPWRLIVGVVGFVAICAALWLVAGRHRRQLAARLAALPRVAEGES